jgi:hypothetical protein
MKITDCFSLDHHITAERVPLVRYYSEYKAIVAVYMGVFLSEEADLMAEYCSKILISGPITVARVRSQEVTGALLRRFNPVKRIPRDDKVYSFDRIDSIVNIIRLQSGQMLHDVQVGPKWDELKDNEISMIGMWAISDDVVKFATEINGEIIERKYVSVCDLFVYEGIEIRNFMCKYPRTQLLFRLIYC